MSIAGIGGELPAGPQTERGLEAVLSLHDYAQWMSGRGVNPSERPVIGLDQTTVDGGIFLRPNMPGYNSTHLVVDRKHDGEGDGTPSVYEEIRAQLAKAGDLHQIDILRETANLIDKMFPLSSLPEDAGYSSKSERLSVFNHYFRIACPPEARGLILAYAVQRLIEDGVLKGSFTIDGKYASRTKVATGELPYAFQLELNFTPAEGTMEAALPYSFSIRSGSIADDTDKRFSLIKRHKALGEREGREEIEIPPEWKNYPVSYALGEAAGYTPEELRDFLAKIEKHQRKFKTLFAATTLGKYIPESAMIFLGLSASGVTPSGINDRITDLIHTIQWFQEKFGEFPTQNWLRGSKEMAIGPELLRSIGYGLASLFPESIATHADLLSKDALISESVALYDDPIRRAVLNLNPDVREHAQTTSEAASRQETHFLFAIKHWEQAEIADIKHNPVIKLLSSEVVHTALPFLAAAVGYAGETWSVLPLGTTSLLLSIATGHALGNIGSYIMEGATLAEGEWNLDPQVLAQHNVRKEILLEIMQVLSADNAMNPELREKIL